MSNLPQSHMRPLSVDEIDAVYGGLPLVPLAGKMIVKCTASSTCRTAVRAGVVGAAAAAGAVVGYENNREE